MTRVSCRCWRKRKQKRDRENKVSLANALKQYLGATTLEPQVQSEVGEDATKLLVAVKEERRRQKTARLRVRRRRLLLFLARSFQVLAS